MAIIDGWEFPYDGEAHARAKGWMSPAVDVVNNDVVVDDGEGNAHTRIPISVLREILRRVDEGDTDEPVPLYVLKSRYEARKGTTVDGAPACLARSGDFTRQCTLGRGHGGACLDDSGIRWTHARINKGDTDAEGGG